MVWTSLRGSDRVYNEGPLEMYRAIEMPAASRMYAREGIGRLCYT